MTFTEEQNNKIIRYLEIIKDNILPELRTALEKWNHVYDMRLDRTQDHNLIDLWQELVDTYYNMMSVDIQNDYETWYNYEDGYILDISDVLVAHEHQKQVWIDQMNTIVYDKLPTALSLINELVDRRQPSLFS